MAYPPYVLTRPVSVGGSMTLEGSESLRIKVTVTSTRSLVWDDTGYRFESRPVSVTSEPGAEAALTLPRTDVAGWRDGRTGALIDVSAPGSHSHTYNALVEFLTAAGTSAGITPVPIGPFVLPAGDGAIDLDKTVPVGTVSGQVLSVPDSWSLLVASAEQAAADARDALLSIGTPVVAPTSGSIPKRTAFGTLKTSTPVDDDDAVSRGSLAPLVARALGTETPLNDGIVEYPWIKPQIFYDAPRRRTIMATLGSTGVGTAAGQALIWITEIDHMRGTTERTSLGSILADEHSVPLVRVYDDGTIKAGWTLHNADNLLRRKVASTRTGLAAAPEQTIDVGGYVSYGQDVDLPHLTTATTSTSWVLHRKGDQEWWLVTEHLNRSTGALTYPNGPGVCLTRTPSIQTYLSTAETTNDDGELVIRCALASNPADKMLKVLYFEINTVTGDITCQFDPEFTANADGTNLPITDTTLPAAVPGGQTGRRLHSVRGDGHPIGILTADWDASVEANADLARYTLHEPTGVMLPGEEGPPAGFDGLGGTVGTVWTAGTPYASYMDAAQGVRVTTSVTLPPSAGTTGRLAEIARRFSGGSSLDWFLRILTSSGGSPQVRFSTSHLTADIGTDSAVLTGVAWGSKILIRATALPSAATNRKHVEFSTDNGATWTQVYGANPANADSPLQVRALDTLIGAGGTTLSHGQVIHSVRVERYTGTAWETVNDVVFAAPQWEPYTLEHFDPQGKRWTLVGSAVVGSSTDGPLDPPRPEMHAVDLGPTGPRVGYTAAANYVGGAFFSPHGSVILARQLDGTTEQVVEALTTPGGVVERVLVERPTSQGRIIRPLPAYRGGPVLAYAPVVTSYTSYTNWRSTMLGVGRY